MKTYAPDYYKSFSCIADKCKHSCCIGWEIDIDEDTLELYKSIGGELGKRLCENISADENGIHSFKLCEGERCPFLNEKGLCELMLECGENALCEICAEHPRFRNYYSDREELGLGLCCEAAAELIVSKKEKTEIVVLSEDDYEEDALTEQEKILLYEKEKALSIITDRSKSYQQRADGLLGNPMDFSGKKLYDILSPLERLSAQWDEVLSALMTAESAQLEDYDTACEQLAVYFIFRHLNNDSEDTDKAIAFALFSVQAVIKAAKAYYGSTPDLSQIADIARMYSAEIEYSDVNVSQILKQL